MMSEPPPAFDKTEWANILLLTYLNYETWNETMTLDLEAMDAYDIGTGGQPEPPQTDIDYYKWKIQAAKSTTMIHLSCSPAIYFLLKSFRFPGAMWTTLVACLKNAVNHIGRTTIQPKFRACRLQKDQTLREYITLLRNNCLQLIGTTQDISDNEMRIHIYNHLPEQNVTMIKILENRIPLSMVKATMDALRSDQQVAGLKLEIGDEANRSAIFSHGHYIGHGGYRGRGMGRYNGRGNNGGNTPGDSNDHKEDTCTHCKWNNHTTVNCGSLKRLNSKEEKLCYRSTKAGHLRPDCRTRQPGFEARTRVNKRNNSKDTMSHMKASLTEATASLAEHRIAAGDLDLF